jgi:chitinase
VSDTPPNPTNPEIPIRSGYRSVAYYGNWDVYTRNFQPQQIPAERLTHLLYSFADNKPDGTVFLTDTYADTEKHYTTDSWNDVGNNVYGSIKQLQILKARNRNLKVLLSIRGWTYTNINKYMDGPMATAAGRQRFASSCVELIRDYGFDGIDVDWEYPANKDQGNQLLALLKEIRSQIDEYGDTLVYGDDAGQELKPQFLLTIASPAGEKNYKHLPLKEISAVTDFVNLMVSFQIYRRNGASTDRGIGIRLRWLLGQPNQPRVKPLSFGLNPPEHAIQYGFCLGRLQRRGGPALQAQPWHAAVWSLFHQHPRSRKVVHWHRR